MSTEEPRRSRAGCIDRTTADPFGRLDPLCGDETLTAPPLVAGVDASPAVALRNAFRGTALGDPWQVSNRRGAFVGTFSR